MIGSTAEKTVTSYPSSAKPTADVKATWAAPPVIWAESLTMMRCNLDLKTTLTDVTSEIE